MNQIGCHPIDGVQCVLGGFGKFRAYEERIADLTDSWQVALYPLLDDLGDDRGPVAVGRVFGRLAPAVRGPELAMDTVRRAGGVEF